MCILCGININNVKNLFVLFLNGIDYTKKVDKKSHSNKNIRTRHFMNKNIFYELLWNLNISIKVIFFVVYNYNLGKNGKNQ